ncbi:hypothetical protein MUP79_03395 [Candidatus Bathyarchaeota archaeon]|nr:hypothetical protein [Candidatus Bathyarchaeota archaeon]
MMLTREVLFMPAYDKRDPNPAKNYGIGSVRIAFIVKGSRGAITLSFYTNWYLPETVAEYRTGFKRADGSFGVSDLEAGEPVKAFSYDYHSKTQRFEGQIKYEDCQYLGGDCYTDGSCLNADPFKKLLLEKGSDGVFEEMEKDYIQHFHEGRQ